MDFLKTFFVVLVFNFITIAFTAQTQALTESSSGVDSRIYYRLKLISPQVFDYQQYYSEVDQTLRVQMGLELIGADPAVENLDLSAMKAPPGQVVFLDSPEYLEGCNQVLGQQFEYTPSTRHHLLMLTLKGPECSKKRLAFKEMHLRIRFQAISVLAETVIPVSLEVKE